MPAVPQLGNIDPSQEVCHATFKVAKVSNCPKDAWHVQVSRAVAESAGSAPLAIVNVGANKGYQVAKFLQLFDRSRAVSSRQWHEALIRVATTSLKRVPPNWSNRTCGGC